MTPLKRAMIGGRVVLDATGTGDMVYGTICDVTERGKMCIRPLDGSEELQADKSILFKPTDAEWKAALAAAADRDEANLLQDAEIEQQDAEMVVILAEHDQAALEKITAEVVQNIHGVASKPAEVPARTLTDIEEEVGRRNGAVHPDYLQRYRKSKSAKGNTGYNCGDQVARALEGKDLDECFDAVEKITGTDYSGHWSNLNPGMRRMNLGNALRRYYKAQESK